MTELRSGAEDAALAEERSRYRDLFEFAPVSYLVTDSAGRIVEANRTAGALLGVDPNRLIGKPITVFVPVENRKQFRQTLLGLAHVQSEAEWELDLEIRNGKRFRAQVNATRPRSGGLRWTIQDVTERVAAEHRLRSLASELEERVLERTDQLEQERVRLAAIVEHMPGGLIIASAPNGTVTFVNERARRMLGIEDGAPLHGIRGAAFRPDGSSYELDDFPLARALRGETVYTEQLHIAGEDGQRFYVDVSAAPIRHRAERVTAAVSLLEDVTEREVRDRAERDFVTNAAHELHSPIAAIASAVEVLQAGAKNAPERDLFIEHIDRQSQRLIRLTRALLTLSRAQTKIEQPKTEVVELRPLLEATAERVEPHAGVVITVDCPPDLMLVANRELLEQLVMNVARNAVKYTDAGSIRLEAELREGRAEIRVVDTGIGISADALPRVTERFYRGEETKEGFGLGLAIVQAALETMDGEFDVSSEGLGRGTTVTISLPLGATRVP